MAKRGTVRSHSVTEEKNDTRHLMRDAIAEIVALTPAWAALQAAAAMVVEDTSLNIYVDAEAMLAEPGNRERVLKRIEADVPSLLRPGAGHNQPPALPEPEALRKELEAKYPQLIARRDALIAAGERFATAYPTIENEDVAGKAAEFVKQLRALVQMAEGHHKPEKDPFNTLGGVVQAFFAGVWEPIKKIQLDVKKKQDLFAATIADANRKKAAAAAAEEHRRAVEAAARAAETMTASDLGAAADAAERAAEAANLAAGPAAEHTRVRGDHGAVSSVRTMWKVRVGDPDKVPREWMIPDLERAALTVRQAPKDREGRPMFDVPGFDVFAEYSTVTR